MKTQPTITRAEIIALAKEREAQVAFATREFIREHKAEPVKSHPSFVKGWANVTFCGVKTALIVGRLAKWAGCFEPAEVFTVETTKTHITITAQSVRSSVKLAVRQTITDTVDAPTKAAGKGRELIGPAIVVSGDKYAVTVQKSRDSKAEKAELKKAKAKLPAMEAMAKLQRNAKEAIRLREIASGSFADAVAFAKRHRAALSELRKKGVASYNVPGLLSREYGIDTYTARVNSFSRARVNLRKWPAIKARLSAEYIALLSAWRAEYPDAPRHALAVTPAEIVAVMVADTAPVIADTAAPSVRVSEKDTRDSVSMALYGVPYRSLPDDSAQQDEVMRILESGEIPPPAATPKAERTLTATLTFPSHEQAALFARDYTRHTLRGHTISAKVAAVHSVTLYKVGEDERQWIDSRIASEQNTPPPCPCLPVEKPKAEKYRATMEKALGVKLKKLRFGAGSMKHHLTVEFIVTGLDVESQDARAGWMRERGVNPSFTQFLCGVIRADIPIERAEKMMLSPADTTPPITPPQSMPVLETKNEPLPSITAGQTLTARSIGDWDCIFTVEILERKGQFVRVKAEGTEKRVKVFTDERGEFIYALGRYSMAPIFRAPSVAICKAETVIAEPATPPRHESPPSEEKPRQRHSRRAPRHRFQPAAWRGSYVECYSARRRVKPAPLVPVSKVKTEKVHPLYVKAAKGEHIAMKDIATLIRDALKREFPRCKFSVKSSRGSAINVRWTDGPSGKAVDSIAGAFETRGFDGSIDLAHSNSLWLYPDGSAHICHDSGTAGSMGQAPEVIESARGAGGIIAENVASCFVHTSRTVTGTAYRRAIEDFRAQNWTGCEDVEWEKISVKEGAYGVTLENVPLVQPGSGWRYLEHEICSLANSYDLAE